MRDTHIYIYTLIYTILFCSILFVCMCVWGKREAEKEKERQIQRD